jgi:hypothetical protein
MVATEVPGIHYLLESRYDLRAYMWACGCSNGHLSLYLSAGFLGGVVAAGYWSGVSGRSKKGFLFDRFEQQREKNRVSVYPVLFSDH